MDDDIVTRLYVLGTAFAYCLPTFIALARGHPNCVPILYCESLARVDRNRLDGSVGLVVNEAT